MRWMLGRKFMDKILMLMSCFLILFYVLQHGKKELYEGNCPPVVWKKTLDSHINTISCRDVIDGDQNEITRASKYFGCHDNDIIEDDNYQTLTRNCFEFKDKRHYDLPNTEEEKQFPIAYSILMYENVYQMETLLNLIYKPQNVYCIHVDSSSQKSVINAVRRLVRCFDNVFIATDLKHVEYGTLSIVEAELSCLRDLWKFKHWKYFINLTGKELPIRTNRELVQILKAYKGGNDIQGLQKG